MIGAASSTIVRPQNIIDRTFNEVFVGALTTLMWVVSQRSGKWESLRSEIRITSKGGRYLCAGCETPPQSGLKMECGMFSRKEDHPTISLCLVGGGVS